MYLGKIAFAFVTSASFEQLLAHMFTTLRRKKQAQEHASVSVCLDVFCTA